MKIWVDADSCPVAIKEILFKAVERKGLILTLVANRYQRTPSSQYIKTIKVGAGLDIADNEIVRLLEAGDLVVTSDIPLAAEVIEKGGCALSPRGELHTTENIRSRLSMRDFMDSLRSSGVDTGGPKALNKRDIKAFAAQLDKLLAR